MKKIKILPVLLLTAISTCTFANKVVQGNQLLVEDGKFPRTIVKAEDLKSVFFDFSMSARDSNWKLDAEGNILSGYEKSSKIKQKVYGTIAGAEIDELNKKYSSGYLLDVLKFVNKKNQCSINLLEKDNIQQLLNQSGGDVLVVDMESCSVSKM